MRMKPARRSAPAPPPSSCADAADAEEQRGDRHRLGAPSALSTSRLAAVRPSWSSRHLACAAGRRSFAPRSARPGRRTSTSTGCRRAPPSSRARPRRRGSSRPGPPSCRRPHDHHHVLARALDRLAAARRRSRRRGPAARSTPSSSSRRHTIPGATMTMSAVTSSPLESSPAAGSPAERRCRRPPVQDQELGAEALGLAPREPRQLRAADPVDEAEEVLDQRGVRRLAARQVAPPRRRSRARPTPRTPPPPGRPARRPRSRGRSAPARAREHVPRLGERSTVAPACTVSPSTTTGSSRRARRPRRAPPRPVGESRLVELVRLRRAREEVAQPVVLRVEPAADDLHCGAGRHSARGGIRTHMPSRAVGFKPTASDRVPPPGRGTCLRRSAACRHPTSGIQPPWPSCSSSPYRSPAGLLAGFVGKKVFNGLWGVIDDEEPPDSKHRDISWGRLLLAGALQGAIFRAVKEATDHARAARLLPHHRHLAGREAPRSRVTSRLPGIAQEDGARCVTG